MDYFVFSKGALRDIVSPGIGRLYWDHWIVWRALSRKVPVIDVSAVVIAVHQNHDYGPATAQQVASGSVEPLRTGERRWPRIALVTPVFNSVRWIEPTIRSVQASAYRGPDWPPVNESNGDKWSSRK